MVLFQYVWFAAFTLTGQLKLRTCIQTSFPNSQLQFFQTLTSSTRYYNRYYLNFSYYDLYVNERFSNRIFYTTIDYIDASAKCSSLSANPNLTSNVAFETLQQVRIQSNGITERSYLMLFSDQNQWADLGKLLKTMNVQFPGSNSMTVQFFYKKRLINSTSRGYMELLMQHFSYETYYIEMQFDIETITHSVKYVKNGNSYSVQYSKNGVFNSSDKFTQSYSNFNLFVAYIDALEQSDVQTAAPNIRLRIQPGVTAANTAYGFIDQNCQKVAGIKCLECKNNYYLSLANNNCVISCSAGELLLTADSSATFGVSGRFCSKCSNVQGSNGACLFSCFSNTILDQTTRLCISGCSTKITVNSVQYCWLGFTNSINSPQQQSDQQQPVQPPDPNPNPQSSGISIGLVVGAIIGSLVGIGAFVVTIYFCCIRKRNLERIPNQNNRRGSINQLHNIQYEEGQFDNQKKQIVTHEDCTICLQSVGTGNLAELQCHHVFHLRCMQDWFKKSKMCPLCRFPIKKIKAINQA